MNNSVEFKIDVPISVENIIDVFRSSGINRPLEDRDRIAEMFDRASLTVSAWMGNELIGLARSLTDFSYCCYLSDLAVKKEFQHKGIGKKLIAITKEKIGDRCMLLLLSAPSAMEYYPKVNFEKVEHGFMIKRSR